MTSTVIKYTMVISGTGADNLNMAAQFIGSKEPAPSWLVAEKRGHVVADQKNMKKYECRAPRVGKSRSSSASTKETQKVTYELTFDWVEGKGIPEVFVLLVRDNEIFLESLTVHPIPNLTSEPLQFLCQSWVATFNKTQLSRIFFVNKSYLPSQTQGLVAAYRETELKVLRGEIGETNGVRKEWDRIYDFATYNDLGDVDTSPELARPILGGSDEYPYPRRLRTGRPPAKKDPNSESRLPADEAFSVYVPKDELFTDQKMTEFRELFPKPVIVLVKSYIAAQLKIEGKEFKSIEQAIQQMYKDGFIFNVDKAFLEDLAEKMGISYPDDGNLELLYPTPKIIEDNLHGWLTDQEFARERLAGINPVIISLLQEFPIKSTLDVNIYGDHTSTITRQQLEKNMNGLTVDEAINSKRLFILNYYELYMTYLRRINGLSNRKGYASRTVLFLQDDGTLKPLAIELSLPHPDGDQHGAVSKVCLPATEGVDGAIWTLAKAYVVALESSHHKLNIHWVNTHAVMEPFAIATQRQLSQLHPIHKLLHPHFHDTLYMNGIARQVLCSAEGNIETTFFPGTYAFEWSAFVFKSWNFVEQALPADLIKRGMAVEDPSAPHGLRLVIEDYPYAADGLLVWDAIKAWVQDYVSTYYDSDETVKQDPELQSWWKESVEVGFGDLKDKDWWPKMQTRQDLVQCCTIIIWLGSAEHAAVNFGQFPYGGFVPNWPTMSRRLIPEEGTEEYEEMVKNPEKALLETIPSKYETYINTSVFNVIANHTSDEIYIGSRKVPYWTSDAKALKDFKKFGERLAEIEKILMKRNEDGTLKNRVGPANIPYTLFFPSSGPGVTGRGIPNSVSV